MAKSAYFPCLSESDASFNIFIDFRYIPGMDGTARPDEPQTAEKQQILEAEINQREALQRLQVMSSLFFGISTVKNIAPR